MTSSNNEIIKPNYNIQVCWVCLDAKCENAIEVKRENGWFTLFEFCVGLSLTSKDEPRLLCRICADTVKTYAEFKSKCHKSDKIWKSVSVTGNVSSYAEKIKIDENIKSGNYIKDNVCTTDVYSKIEPNPPGNSDIFEYDFENDSNIEIFKQEPNIVNIDSKEESDTNVKNINCLKIEQDCKDIKKLQSIRKINLNEEKHGAKRKVAKCKFCRKPYKYKKKLITHMASCTYKSKKNNLKSKESKCKKEILVCEKEKSFENCLINCVPEQATEMCNENQANLIFCGLCKFSSTNSNDINQHLNEHWANNDLGCKLCYFVGVDSAHFLVHRYFHYPENNKPRLYCHICKKNVITLLTLQYHYRAMHLKRPGGLCWYCMKEYNGMIKWRLHVRRHESLFASNYICDYCGKKFTYKHSITEHMEHLHLGTRKFICETCGRVFYRNSHLVLHRRCVHEKSLPVKCMHCNRMFKNQMTFVKHQKREHLLKPFKCKVCSKSFANQYVLGQHMIWHSDERPFKCSTCGLGYKARSQLKIHMRTHTGERPYECKHCERSFTSSNQLKVHSSVHTGVRAYKCNYCERSFNEKKQLQAHRTSRHKTIDSANVIKTGT